MQALALTFDDGPDPVWTARLLDRLRALDARATEITEKMKTAAAHAIAEIVGTEELREDYIIPSVFNRDVAPAVAAAVAAEASAPTYSSGS